MVCSTRRTLVISTLSLCVLCYYRTSFIIDRRFSAELKAADASMRERARAAIANERDNDHALKRIAGGEAGTVVI